MKTEVRPFSVPWTSSHIENLYWKMSRYMNNVLQNLQMVPNLYGLKRSCSDFWDTFLFPFSMPKLCSGGFKDQKVLFKRV